VRRGPTEPPGLDFRSRDGRFGLTVGRRELDRILTACGRAEGKETGGIVIGHYNDRHDRAIVTAVSLAPPDSRSGRTWFARGAAGLQAWIDRLWRSRRDYYLGEWHFHPFASAQSSPTDLAQMRAFAESPLLRCPEPVLLIIGGDPVGTWEARAYVAPRGEPLTELHPPDP
jgi:integrative and conjugative element protein (TIGR02256 family)